MHSFLRAQSCPLSNSIFVELKMQEKTISIIKLTEDNGAKPFRPSEFIGTLTAPMDRHIIAAIEEASGKDEFPAVCISLAAFKEGTLKAGKEKEIDSYAGVFIDLDANKPHRPKEPVVIADLVKYVEEAFPNTGAVIYPSFSTDSGGGHLYLLYDKQCTDAEVNADTATMVRSVLFNSPYKDYLDEGSFTPERKIYIRKGTEPRILLGEGLDSTKRYYADAAERKAVEDNIKQYFKDKKENKPAPSADKEELPDDYLVIELLDEMKDKLLIGDYQKSDKWWNINTPQWEQAGTNPQWRMPADCRNVTGWSGGDMFRSVSAFTKKRIIAYKEGFSGAKNVPISMASETKLMKAAKAIDTEAHKNDKKKDKSDKVKKTEASAFMKSKEGIIREIIITNFKTVLEKAGAMLYRVESTGTYKNTYYCIQDKGYTNVMFGGGKGGKMKFIDIFGAAEWDRMVEDIKIDILVMKEYNNDRSVAETHAEGMIINKENTTAELVREVLLSQAEQFESATDAIMDGINVFIVDSCRKQKIKSVFDIKRNNSLYWCKKNRRLECWMDEYKLFDNNFNNILPSATEKIYTNDDNSYKKELTDVTSLIDMAVVNDILSDLDKYIKDNPRLLTGGKWQGVFLAGMPMTAIMSSYLGLTAARPVVGVKGTMGMGKSYIVDFLLSVMGKDFGTKRSGGISEAALRREASASGILAVDDNMADDKQKAKIFQHIIKTSFDGNNIVKCSMSADAGGKLEEFPLNSMLLFSGTFIPSDVNDGNSEAESRTTIMTVERGNNENSEVAYKMKVGLPKAKNKNENDDKRPQAFRFFMISKVDEYIKNYERVQQLYNKYAGDNRMNNGDRRSDIAAAMMCGYLTLFNKTISDEEMIRLFLEYSNAADSISKNDSFVYDFFTNAIRIGSDSKSVRDDTKEDDDKDVYIDRKNESVAVGMSIYEFANDDKCTPEVAKLFGDYGVFKGSRSSASDAVMDTLFIKDRSDIFKAKTLTGEELAVGVDKNIARSNILLKEEFKAHKNETMIYPYVTADKKMDRKKLKAHISISLVDLEKICGEGKQKKNENDAPKKAAINYDDVPF